MSQLALGRVLQPELPEGGRRGSLQAAGKPRPEAARGGRAGGQAGAGPPRDLPAAQGAWPRQQALVLAWQVVWRLSSPAGLTGMASQHCTQGQPS